MGYREVKAAILRAIDQDRVNHEARATQGEKNLLAVGDISLGRARHLVARARGSQASSSPHHLMPELEVWVLQPTDEGTRWYIKCYLRGDDLYFVSFHPSEKVSP